jgi:Terminase small subunit
MNAETPKTPSGRIPNTPLRNPRHEALVHAVVQGKSGREAGLAAGYKDGPSLKGNIARLRQEPQIVERLAEVAAKSAELADIYDGWVLNDVKLFAKVSLADFCQRDEQGRIVLVGGKPVVDFTHVNEEQYRVVESLKPTKYGHELKLRDPVAALDKLMRHLGLMRDKVALTDPSGLNAGIVRFIIESAP